MDKNAAQSQRLHGEPSECQKYRHYKGGIYEVLQRSVKEDTLEPLVTYRSVETGGIWTRTLANWNDVIDGQPRFAPLGKETVAGAARKGFHS